MNTKSPLVSLIENTRAVGSSAYFGERGEWLIVQAVHRDSDVLSRSNFKVAHQMLRNIGAEDSIAIERFNHWAVGWIDYLIVNPECAPAVELSEEIREKIENYPVLDEDDFSAMEHEEANEIWKNCYSVKERIEYVREHRSQFEFRELSDLLGCIRGHYFAGYASELIG